MFLRLSNTVCALYSNILLAIGAKCFAPKCIHYISSRIQVLTLKPYVTKKFILIVSCPLGVSYKNPTSNNSHSTNVASKQKTTKCLAVVDTSKVLFTHY